MSQVAAGAPAGRVPSTDSANAPPNPARAPAAEPRPHSRNGRPALHPRDWLPRRNNAGTLRHVTHTGFLTNRSAQTGRHVVQAPHFTDQLLQLSHRDSHAIAIRQRVIPQVTNNTYIQAGASEVVADFDETGLIELIVQRGAGAIDALPVGIRNNKDAVAETIINNVCKAIIDERALNPKYYDTMSSLLDALILQRRQEALDYKDFLEKLLALATKVGKRESDTTCPDWATNGTLNRPGLSRGRFKLPDRSAGLAYWRSRP